MILFSLSFSSLNSYLALYPLVLSFTPSFLPAAKHRDRGCFGLTLVPATPSQLRNDLHREMPADHRRPRACRLRSSKRGSEDSIADMDLWFLSDVGISSYFPHSPLAPPPTPHSPSLLSWPPSSLPPPIPLSPAHRRSQHHRLHSCRKRFGVFSGLWTLDNRRPIRGSFGWSRQAVYRR